LDVEVPYIQSLNIQVWTELKLFMQDSNRYHLAESLWYGGARRW